jgi:hypothetical protein
MVIVQVRSQMVSNGEFATDSRFEEKFLHVPREIRPQCERGLTRQAFELVGRIIHHRITLARTLSHRWTPFSGGDESSLSRCRAAR